MRTYDYKGKQFGRHAKVEILNYVTGQKHTFDNRFNISFEFFKTIDEATNASVGRIRIDGISRKTVDQINSEGGEVKLYCGYEGTEIKLLFVAHIVRMYAESGQGSSALVIECSANMMDYFFRTSFYDSSDGTVELTPAQVIKRYTNPTRDTFIIDLTASGEESLAAIKEYFLTASIKVNFVGDIKHILQGIAEAFCLDMKADPVIEGGQDTGRIQYTFTLKTSGVNEILDRINEGYAKINRTDDDKAFIKQQQEYQYLFVDKVTEYKRAWLLTYKTGLLSYQPEFKVVNALLTKELAANESLTVPQQRKEQELLAKERDKALKEAQRQEKAKEKGKEVKPKTQKVPQKQVTRQFLKVRALLNPDLRPQSHIMIIEDGEFKIFRVRDVVFKGVNNSGGEWVMELSCEDSGGKYDRAPTAAEIAAMNREVAQNETGVNAELENNTTYGAGETNAE